MPYPSLFIESLRRDTPRLHDALIERGQKALSGVDYWITQLTTGNARVHVARLLLLLSTNVSVSSQADTENADLERERAEQLNQPEFELEELAEIYVKRGVEAALTSAATFSVGAAMPLAMVLVSPAALLPWTVSIASLLFLALLGAVGAYAGGALIWRATLRVTFWGALASWGEIYPIVINSWRNIWENLSVYFKYPEDIRRVIYTTNAIEAVHRQFRKQPKPRELSPMKTA